MIRAVLLSFDLDHQGLVNVSACLYSLLRMTEVGQVIFCIELLWYCTRGSSYFLSWSFGEVQSYLEVAMDGMHDSNFGGKYVYQKIFAMKVQNISISTNTKCEVHHKII